MDFANDFENEKTMFNVALAKCVGLYQILNPKTVKFHGHNVYRIIVILIAVYGSLKGIIFGTDAIYYGKNNVAVATLWFSIAQNSFFLVYKVLIILNNSKKLWILMDITRFNYLSYKHYNKNLFKFWQTFSLRVTYTYSLLTFCPLIIFILSPLIFKESVFTLKNHDGSFSSYRLNLVNLQYFNISEDVYNTYFYIFYIMEVMDASFFLIYFNINDVLLITLCLAINCQLHLISDAIASLGHNFVSDQPNGVIPKIHLNEACNSFFTNLRTFMIDHQKIIKHLDDFLAIFQRALLIQIAVSSISIIVLWFTFTVTFIEGDTIDTTATVKMFSLIPMFIFQLFILCYLFENIHNQKNSIIFALYSSNWSEMNLKCKSLVLLSMKMNNANEKTLQFSNTKIINLEMFFQTIQFCYSIFSTFINVKKQDTQT